MIHIRRTSVWCTVSKDIDHKCLYWLHSVLSITTQAYVRGRLHFYKLRLFDKRRMRFPSGLLDVVCRKALEKGLIVEVEDCRPKTKPIKPLPESCAHLYDYQKAAVEVILEKKNGIIKLPTGSGKTQAGIALALRVNCPVLWLVDEKGLALQAMERWKQITGTQAGFIGDGEITIEYFTVAMIQSLRSRLQTNDSTIQQYLQDVGCLIIDEVHILGAKTHYKTVISIPNAVYRIGLSATPTGRSDRKDAYVIGATGPIRYKMNIGQLVDMGKLAKAAVVFYKYPGARDIPKEDSGKWHILYERGIVCEEARHRAVLRICKVTPRPVLVFFERKRHGFRLLDMLQQAGFSVDIVYGAHGGKERLRLATKLGRGELDVLLASRVFNKGIDIPEIRSAINAAGYKAVITSMQKMGRPMRVSEGKDQFVFWDLVDSHNETLLKHSRYRARIYRKEGLSVMVTDTLATAMDKLTEIGMIKKHVSKLSQNDGKDSDGHRYRPALEALPRALVGYPFDSLVYKLTKDRFVGWPFQAM